MAAVGSKRTLSDVDDGNRHIDTDAARDGSSKRMREDSGGRSDKQNSSSDSQEQVRNHTGVQQQHGQHHGSSQDGSAFNVTDHTAASPPPNDEAGDKQKPAGKQTPVYLNAAAVAAAAQAAVDGRHHSFHPPRSETAGQNGTRTSRTVFALVGGCGNAFERLNVLELFDPVSESNALCAPLSARRAFAAAVLLDGKIWAIGGHDGLQALNSVEVWDPATDTWSQAPSMNATRTGAAAVATRGRIYVLGGDVNTPAGSCDQLECFDPQTEKWTLVAGECSSREMFAMAAHGDYIYVGGGMPRWHRDSPVSTFDRYNLDTCEWEPLPSMPRPRCVFALVVFQDRLWAIGGHNGHTALASTDIFDPATNTWTAFPAALHVPRPMVMAGVCNGRLVVFGGVDSKSGKRKSIEQLNRDQTAWVKCGMMYTRRASGGLCEVTVTEKMFAKLKRNAPPRSVDSADSTVEEQASRAMLEAGMGENGEYKAASTKCTRDARCPKPSGHPGRCKILQSKDEPANQGSDTTSNANMAAAALASIAGGATPLTATALGFLPDNCRSGGMDRMFGDKH